MNKLKDIRRQIDPCLQKMEEERLNTLANIAKAKKWYSLPLLLLASAIVGLFLETFLFAGLQFIFAIIGFIIVAVFKVGPYRNNYTATFKTEAFSTFIEALYPNVYYAPDNYLPSNLFDESKLCGCYNEYEGEDYFEGKTENGRSFKFSELKVVDEDTTTDSDGNTETNTTNVFTGLFFVLKVPNRVDGQIQVLPDKAESTFGKMGKFFQKNVGAFFKRSTMVYMEGHPEFEKEFVVYSKNEEEAYRILTPNLLQAIYDLRYKWQTQLSISFIGHKIYVAMPTEKDFFNPNINRSILEDKLLQELYDELALCFAVVEDLSLEHKPDESRILLNSTINPSNSKDNPFLL